MLVYMTVPLNESERSLLEETYNNYRNAMYAIAYSIVRNRLDAEDIVQEVFHKLAKKYMATLSRLNKENALLYYLLTATKNTALSYFSKPSIMKEIPVDPTSFASFPASDESFEDQFDSLDTSLLAEKIRTLNSIYQDVIYQHFVLELSIREIADLNHMPLATAKKRLLRAKQQLRDMCKEEKKHG